MTMRQERTRLHSGVFISSFGIVSKEVNMYGVPPPPTSLSLCAHPCVLNVTADELAACSSEALCSFPGGELSSHRVSRNEATPWKSIVFSLLEKSTWHWSFSPKLLQFLLSGNKSINHSDFLLLFHSISVYLPRLQPSISQ